MTRLRCRLSISLDGFVAGPLAGDDLHGLELARVVVAPGVTHLKLTRK